MQAAAPQGVKLLQRLIQKLAVQLGIVGADNPLHHGRVGEGNIVEDAAAQKCVRQLLFRVGGDDNEGAVLRPDGFLCLRNVKLHSVQFPQEIVGKFQISLVDLVDQQNHLFFGLKRLAHLSKLDIFFYIVDAGLAELTVVQPGHGVIDIQAVLSLGGGFDVPNNQIEIQRLRRCLCQHGLARAGFALDEQGLLKRPGDVRHPQQLRRGDIVLCAFQFLHSTSMVKIP
ncbi:hypothetical protein SDC9_143692 [bioreactor metagenome]|uniref:Uncharacterized protein n=1 Tax=bioreactor metagenome TaxID=1076179 RepID=A0A645E564_9ZZZZ